MAYDSDTSETAGARLRPGRISTISGWRGRRQPYFAVTLWLTDLVVDHLGRQSGAAFHSARLSARDLLPMTMPGFDLIIAFVALTLLGFLAANLIRRKLVDFGEACISRMPVVRPIYHTVRRIFHTLFSKSD